MIDRLAQEFLKPRVLCLWWTFLETNCFPVVAGQQIRGVVGMLGVGGGGTISGNPHNFVGIAFTTGTTTDTTSLSTESKDGHHLTSIMKSNLTWGNCGKYCIVLFNFARTEWVQCTQSDCSYFLFKFCLEWMIGDVEFVSSSLLITYYLHHNFQSILFL